MLTLRGNLGILNPCFCINRNLAEKFGNASRNVVTVEYELIGKGERTLLTNLDKKINKICP